MPLSSSESIDRPQEMSLCNACAAIRFEDLHTSGGVPFNRTTSDVEACAKSCQLCALIMSASHNEWLPNNPLYRFSITATDRGLDGSVRDGKLQHVVFYSLDVTDTEPRALQSREGAHQIIDGIYTLDLRHPKAQRSILSVVSDTGTGRMWCY